MHKLPEDRKHLTIRLPDHLLTKIKRLSVRQGVTVQSTLLAGFFKGVDMLFWMKSKNNTQTVQDIVNWAESTEEHKKLTGFVNYVVHRTPIEKEMDKLNFI